MIWVTLAQMFNISEGIAEKMINTGDADPSH